MELFLILIALVAVVAAYIFYIKFKKVEVIKESVTVDIPAPTDSTDISVVPEPVPVSTPARRGRPKKSRDPAADTSAKKVPVKKAPAPSKPARMKGPPRSKKP